MNEEQIENRIDEVQKIKCGIDMEAFDKKNNELLDLFRQLSFIKKQKIRNTKIKKSKKNYDHLASSLVIRLLKSDDSLKLFFNILEQKIQKVNIQEIKDILKEVYPINKDSIKSLNTMLKKYKVIIEDKPLKVNPKTSLPIQTRDVYIPLGYRQHGKPTTIYNRNHLPVLVQQ